MNKIKFINTYGTPYERGKITGEIFRAVLSESSKKYKKMLESNEISNQLKKIEQKLKNIFPNYLQEIYGRADGANLNKDVYLLMMCPELINEGVGCTTIVYRNSNGNFILSHNEDDVFKLDNACITKCITESGWFITYDYSNMPLGNAFSWNSSGIVKTINYCYSKKYNLDGIPRYFIQRHISEASSLEDFIQRCKICPRASGFHAVALDINKNKAISVEITHDNISVKNIENFYIHTNHYIHKKINNNKIITSENSTSEFRLKKASNLLNSLIKKSSTSLTVKEIKGILQYRGIEYKDSILAIKNEPNFTCANITVNTSDIIKVYLDFYTTNEKFIIDYNTMEKFDDKCYF